MISIFAPISVIVFVNFLSSVENKTDVDCFVNRMFLSLDNPRNVLFTKQSTSDLFDVNLRKITNTITDIAQKIDIIKEGGSLLY